MNILWFTNTPSLYEQGKHHYHGGGWIESLVEIVRERSEIKLAIAFFHPSDNVKQNYQTKWQPKQSNCLFNKELDWKN